MRAGARDPNLGIGEVEGPVLPVGNVVEEEEDVLRRARERAGHASAAKGQNRQGM